MAHYNDMREFLEELKKRGDLMVIDKKVSPVHEICAFTRKSSDMGGPALLFTNVEGYDMPVLSGLYGTRERVHLALGLGDDTKSVIKEYVAHENKFIPPVTVGDDEAPVHEVVLTGDAVDLYKLPILTNFEKDLGPYITAGVQMANDPITGVRNSSMHRMLLLDKNHMTCFAPKGRHLGTIIERNEDNGKGTEIATVIGGDPIIAIASQCRPALGTDEMGMAGGLRGEAVKMVKCKTIDVSSATWTRFPSAPPMSSTARSPTNSPSLPCWKKQSPLWNTCRAGAAISPACVHGRICPRRRGTMWSMWSRPSAAISDMSPWVPSERA